MYAVDARNPGTSSLVEPKVAPSTRMPLRMCAICLHTGRMFDAFHAQDCSVVIVVYGVVDDDDAWLADLSSVRRRRKVEIASQGCLLREFFDVGR